ncbi:hypothetical protein ACEPAF_9330 [Sanghuangporus sanghuang]
MSRHSENHAPGIPTELHDENEVPENPIEMPVEKHERHFWSDGNLYIQAITDSEPRKKILFRVHKSLLSAHSPFFHMMFTLPAPAHLEESLHANSEACPIEAPLGMSAEKLSDLMDMLLFQFQEEITESAEKLINVLDLSTRYDVPQARKWAIRHLTKLNIHEINRFILAKTHRVEAWIDKSFEALIRTPLSDLVPLQRELIGDKTILIVATTREQLELHYKRIAIHPPPFHHHPSCTNAELCEQSWTQLWWTQIANRLLHYDDTVRVSLDQLRGWIDDLPKPGVSPECRKNCAENVGLASDTEKWIIKMGIDTFRDMEGVSTWNE